MDNLSDSIKEDIQTILNSQDALFRKGKTKSVSSRKQSLLKLYEVVKRRETEICTALSQDLGRSPQESYMTEIGGLLSEISWLIKNLEKLCRVKPVKTPLAHMPGSSYLVPEPLGRIFVISPWNYPILLALQPAANAVAAGNTVIIKPSELSPASSAVVKAITEEAFPNGQVITLEGGKEMSQVLLNHKHDHIFFTGSTALGRLVLEKAAVHLAPVTLELGGKSPCIIDGTANIKTAARRIVFGKFLNAGQTCIAPDYVLVDRSIAADFLEELKKVITEFYGENPLTHEDYGKIINKAHFQRITAMIQREKIFFGGQTDGESKIAPTIIDGGNGTGVAMEEEIFGPVLPVIIYVDIEEVFTFINNRPKPLALYLFTADKKLQKRVLRDISFGGGCINDTLIHGASPYLPFGGVGESGMGRYHGKSGFDTFTNYKSIFERGKGPEPNIKYHPYSKTKLSLLRRFFK